MERLKDHWIVALVGLVASTIGIFVFISGIGSLRSAGGDGGGSVRSPATTSPTDPVISETPLVQISDTPTEPATKTPTDPVTSDTPTDPSTSETPKLPEPLKIESIVIEFDDIPAKIGPAKYQVRNGGKAGVTFWWTTFTSQGRLDGRNCTVVVQIRNKKTKTLVSDGDFRTATCSFEGGWVTMRVPEGSFELSVKVEAAGGSARTARSDFAVYGGA